MVNLLFGKGEEDGVKSALATMSLSKSLVQFINVNQSNWTNFGKKNSHLYRIDLMDRFEKKKMTPEQIVMVYFFTAVIKNKNRIIKAMDNMGAEANAMPWFFAVKDFFVTETEQYVTKAEKLHKFPVVNLPNTNPGLDIMLWMLTVPSTERTLMNMKERVTFTQMNLAADMQTLAKQGYENYWNNVVKGTKNDDRVEAPMMREEYYKNPESDKYNFITLDMKQVMPSNKSTGYTKAEIERYIENFNKAMENMVKETVK